MTLPPRLGAAGFIAALALGTLAPSRAAAFEFYVSRVPRTATMANSVGTVRPCITCHDNGLVACRKCAKDAC